MPTKGQKYQWHPIPGRRVPLRFGPPTEKGTLMASTPIVTVKGRAAKRAKATAAKAKPAKSAKDKVANRATKVSRANGTAKPSGAARDKPKKDRRPLRDEAREQTYYLHKHGSPVRSSDEHPWQNVSEDFPCPACGKPDWCSISSDGAVAHCRRNAKSAVSKGWVYGEAHKDQNGQTYTRWRPTGESERKEPLPAPPKIRSVKPDILHQVYLILLENIRLDRQAYLQLKKRGLSQHEISRGRYGYLDGRRRQAVQAVIDAGLAKHLRRVPGFFKEDGRWRFSGPLGIAVPVRDQKGRIVAIKIRADQPQNGNKYFYASSKKYEGPGPGSPVHVPIHGADDDVRNETAIRITEGELKADIATARTEFLTLGLPGVAAFSKAAPDNLARLHGKTVIIAFDADYRKNPAVSTALLDAIAFFSKSFQVVVEQWPPSWGKGIDDVLVAGRKPRRLRGSQIDGFVRKLRGITGVKKELERPVIEITAEEKDVNDQAVAGLINDDTVFKRGGVLVHVIPDDGQGKMIYRPKGTPRIAFLPAAVLRERLAEAAKWLRRNKEGDLVPAHVPNWSVNAIHARGHWQTIRPLEGIVTGPVLRADGSILAASGYDPDTGLLCQLDVNIPDVPCKPSRQSIHRAIAHLEEAVRDFPFETEEHRATWFAMLLTLLARPAFSGPTPMFLLDANVRGSGKGLLFDLAALIATGRMIPRTPHPTDKEETRKLIMSLALAGDPTVMLDNVEGEFGNSALEAALTSVMWKDRILGESRIAELPLMPVWVATGNNVVLVGDMPRRVAHIRLRSPLENPEDRTDLRHPRLLKWAEQERGRLLAAGLTLLRGYWMAGKPNQNLVNWGSYEGWSELVRATVVWAGMPDPAETRRNASKQDMGIQAFKALMTAIRAFDPKGAGLTASEMIRLITDSKTCNMEMAETMREALAYICDTKTGGLPSPKIIGMKLAHIRERVIDDRFINSKSRNNTSAWYVADMRTGTSGTSGTFSHRPRGKNPECCGRCIRRGKK